MPWQHLKNTLLCWLRSYAITANVVHILDSFVVFSSENHEQGLGVVVISTNDAENYPEDVNKNDWERKNLIQQDIKVLFMN